MKRLLLSMIVFLFIYNVTNAQLTPFAKYGDSSKVLTVSNGKYQEVFNHDSIVRVGSIVLNIKQRKITHFVLRDTMQSEATLEPEVVSRWLSPDPITTPYLSPYTGMSNNPIIYFDPDGRKVVFVNARSEEIFTRLYNAASGEQKAQLDVLKSSEVVYNINVNANVKGGQTLYNFKTNQVDLHIEDVADNEGKTFGIIGDETTHAYQFNKGDIGYVDVEGQVGVAGYDLKDEVNSKQGSIDAIDAINKKEGKNHEYPGMVKRLKTELDKPLPEGKTTTDVVDEFFKNDETGKKYLKYDLDEKGKSYGTNLPGSQLDGAKVQDLHKDKAIDNYIYRENDKTVTGK